MASAPAHPALRVPVPGDGAGEGDWGGVHIKDGVPLLFARPAEVLASQGHGATAPLDELDFEGMCYLARYLPSLLGPGAPLRRSVRRLLAAHAPDNPALGVEAGCSVGADLRAMADICDHVVGFDGNIIAARAARAQLAGEPLAVIRRIEGRRFETDEAPLHLPAVDNVTIVAGDALDPPLRAACSDVTVALNLLDNVSEPINLLGQLDAITRPGGLLLLASPFSWQDRLTPPANQLGGGLVPGFNQVGSEEALRLLLTGQTPLLPLDYEILETGDVDWTIQEHARAWFHYRVHLVAARKRGGS